MKFVKRRYSATETRLGGFQRRAVCFQSGPVEVLPVHAVVGTDSEMSEEFFPVAALHSALWRRRDNIITRNRTLMESTICDQ